MASARLLASGARQTRILANPTRVLTWPCALEGCQILEIRNFLRREPSFGTAQGLARGVYAGDRRPPIRPAACSGHDRADRLPTRPRQPGPGDRHSGPDQE